MLLPHFVPSYVHAFKEEKAYCPLLGITHILCLLPFDSVCTDTST